MMRSTQSWFSALIALVICLLAPPPCAAADFSLAPILVNTGTSATVYPVASSLVLRAKSLVLGSGTQTVAITGQPVYAESDPAWLAASGSVWGAIAAAGDDLGDHTATSWLQLGTNKLVFGAGELDFNEGYIRGYTSGNNSNRLYLHGATAGLIGRWAYDLDAEATDDSTELVNYRTVTNIAARQRTIYMGGSNYLWMSDDIGLRITENNTLGVQYTSIGTIWLDLADEMSTSGAGEHLQDGEVLIVDTATGVIRPAFPWLGSDLDARGQSVTNAGVVGTSSIKIPDDGSSPPWSIDYYTGRGSQPDQAFPSFNSALLGDGVGLYPWEGLDGQALVYDEFSDVISPQFVWHFGDTNTSVVASNGTIYVDGLEVYTGAVSGTWTMRFHKGFCVGAGAP